MKSFCSTEKPVHYLDSEYLPFAQLLWGTGPLPRGAKIVGGYSDQFKAGALILLLSGVYVCGIAGSISGARQIRKKRVLTRTGEPA